MRRITHVVLFLCLTVVMISGFSFDTMAYREYEYTVPGYENYVPPKHIKLDKKKITLYKKCSITLKLKDASKNVRWSTTNNKIVRLKKKGNRVVIYWKKKGKCKVRAHYNGRTYTCAVTCKGIKKNAVYVPSWNMNVNLKSDITGKWQHTTLYLDYNSTTIDIYYYLKNTRLYYTVEDPQIASVEVWKRGAYDDDAWKDPRYYDEIIIKALKPGKTRILITNSHNRKEIDYVTVGCEDLETE